MKSKGFTLIELLAVIVVLGIIMLIAITAVNNVIINSRLNGFKSSSQMLEKAASTYLNTNNLVVASGSTLEISYNTLKTNGFINKVSDPKSNSECTNSRVYVTNVSGTYKYTGALVCDNYMDINAYNLVTNGDFSNGTTGWIAGSGTISASNNILLITGNGTAVYPQTSQSLGLVSVVGHKILLRFKVRVTNSSCTAITYMLSSSGMSTQSSDVVYNPSINTYYSISKILTVASGASGNANIFVYHRYADAATANGKVMQVDGTVGVYAFDLTAIYGAGNEPTEAQMDNIMNNMGK